MTGGRGYVWNLMATAATTVTRAQIRRTIVHAQGFAGRFRRAGEADVEGAIRRLGAVQLDSISAVDRAHRLTLAARIGHFDPEHVPALLRAGRVFEYWAHEASLLPIELWPHFRAAMAGNGHWGLHDRALRQHGELVEPILARIRDEGALPSRAFDAGGVFTGGGMWNLKPAKLVLEALWDSGRLVVAGRQAFQRVYDLPERVIPQDVLELPPPPEDETLRTLALLAVRARGALTEAAIREHWRLKGGKARLHHHLLALVDDGLLREVQVDDGGAPFYVAAETEVGGDPAPPVLVSPFDNLVWDRPLLERVFGFRHVIEVYKREHERVYGYYVLPLLAGDRFLGRADLKADRADGILRVKRFTPEPRVRGNVSEKLERAAHRLARTIGLERAQLA
jgi:uncharacterized protein YcaQ